MPIFQIENRFTGSVLFEKNCGDLKIAVQAAVESGANLSGANLSGADLIDAGQDSRGFRFVAYLSDFAVRIIAGCRDFTLVQAHEHWTIAHDDDPALKAECLAKVELIAAVAKARGWIESEHEAA